MQFLDKLRQKPEPLRRAIAFWASALITFLIVAVWAVHLSVSVSGRDSSQVASPFETIKNEFSNLKAK